MNIQPFELPSVPLEEPVLVFTLALAAFLVAPLLIKRAGLPGIVGIVLVGAIIGPGGLGILGLHGAIILLGEVGLIYLLFSVGLELDLRGFRESPGSAALFGLMSFGLPFVLGAVGGYTLVGLDPLASLLLAAVFASHTLLAYPIINRLGLEKNEAVTAVFGGILFTDTIALIVLALVLGAHEGEFGTSLVLEIAISLVILFGVIWFTLPRLGRWFFRSFSQESYFEFLFVITAFFLAASLASVLDLAGILGAFVAGLALNRLIPEGGTLHNRLEFAGNALFIPFFLLYVGMLVQVGVIIDGPNTLIMAGFILGIMFVTKWIAAWIVSTVKGYSSTERTVIWGLSTGQAAAALAITLLGFEAGLFDAVVLNAVVLMLLVTAIVSPWVTERYGAKLAIGDREDGPDPKPFDPRILLPLSHGAQLQRRLLELSFLLRADDADEPVFVLTVVPPGDPQITDDRIEQARADLDELRPVASAAEVPIQIESRVNHNVASGIAQASIEEQISLVIMGWDARRSFRARMFGSVIDNVLDQISMPVMIARLGHPINTTRRVWLLLPAGITYHDGYFEGIYLVKKLVDRLGIDLTVIVVDDETEQYANSLAQVEPELEPTFQNIPDWKDVHAHLDAEVDEEDLVCAIAAEPGSVGWHSALAELPIRLASLPPESFIMLYPREGKPTYDRRFLRFK